MQKGGSSARYGSGAIGGSLHLNSYQKPKNGLHGAVGGSLGSFKNQQAYGKLSFGNDKWNSTIKFSDKNAELVVEKGSIGIDGCSMTVADCGANWLEVCVISHTFAETLFGVKKEGDGVNLEFDILGKYILRRAELEAVK